MFLLPTLRELFQTSGSRSPQLQTPTVLVGFRPQADHSHRIFGSFLLTRTLC
ncbi:unnamed protein product [Brassica oleracea]